MAEKIIMTLETVNYGNIVMLSMKGKRNHQTSLRKTSQNTSHYRSGVIREVTSLSEESSTGDKHNRLITTEVLCVINLSEADLTTEYYTYIDHTVPTRCNTLWYMNGKSRGHKFSV